MKLFTLVKRGGIKIFIKIELEVRIFDLTNSVKMKFSKKGFATIPPDFLNI